MKKLQFQYFLVFGLLVLLSVLAFFQYKWVGQISEAEEERLQKRLDIDAKHFADDFNRIVQNAYFSFQINGEDWQNSFIEHYDIWQQKSPYPQLIKSFEIVLPTHEIVRFDSKGREFVKTGALSNFNQLQTYFEPIEEENLTLRMPIYEQTNQLPIETPIPSPILQTPNLAAFLVMKLDEETIKTSILNELNNKYFPDGNFKLSIKSKRTNEPLFQSKALEKADVSVGIFELMPENMAFFVNRNLMTTLNQTNSNRRIIINQRLEQRIENNPTFEIRKEPNTSMKIQVFGSNQNQLAQGMLLSERGRWVLNIQHKDGSLERFVGNTRQRNLFISFGILGLLGGSIGLIFLSARRAQVLAQRQLDFVSAVSHEFRTPISVIYSAAQNLEDGVAKEVQQVSRYGNLIKSEGKKLSGMVEQILEFAGARSGLIKYDFRETDVKNLVKSALIDCQHLVDENQFKIEIYIDENLPSIQADSNSLSHAIQNLIINGIKYSNGNNLISISVKNVGDFIQITVEDKGMGIGKKDLKQIFEPFYRAKEVVDAQIHGNGLGLSLVKQTIEAHNGKIKVESEIGKGSKFIIDLPLNINKNENSISRG